MYLLDSNTYIEAKNRYYRMTFCPAYWDWLDRQFAEDKLASIKPVYEEICGKGDELADWVRMRPHHFRAVSSISTQDKFASIAKTVASDKMFNEAKVSVFLKGADPWLIAEAFTSKATVVPQEFPRGTKSKIKIPDLCDALSVPWISTFDLIDALGAQFVLESKALKTPNP